MATKKSAKKKGGQSGAMLAAEIGAGVLAAAAAAGAGYYFYGAKGAKKHRHAASVWAKGMKRDVIRQAKKVKKIDQAAMAAIVDEVARGYSTARGASAADVHLAATELKRNWDAIRRELGASTKRVTKAVKKAAAPKKAAKKSPAKAKKPVKKVAKKAAKKR